MVGGTKRGIFNGRKKVPPMTRQSTTGKLPAIKIKQAKPKSKSYKLSDGGGMYLLVNPNGSKYWRWKYRINKKENTLASYVQKYEVQTS
jgi:hypothetical protein